MNQEVKSPIKQESGIRPEKTLEEKRLERENRKKRRGRIIIRNLSFNTTEQSLKEHFSKFGNIEEVNLLRKSNGRLVGCAFVQYEKVQDATKAIGQSNGKELGGRVVHLDWAVGKDKYVKHMKQNKQQQQKVVKSFEEIEVKEESDVGLTENVVKKEEKDEEDDDSDKSDDESDDYEDEEEEEEQEEVKPKLRQKITNDVSEGCTVFIKCIPFDASDDDLQNVCKQFGPIHYALINMDPVSGHSKGTGFVKFQKKESADLCLSAGTEFKLFEQILDPVPALSRNDIRKKKESETKKEPTDSRHLYLAKEGLIVAGSSAAEDVSPSDMAKRLRLEQMKTQMLKSLNRFVSPERLTIHNIPISYDSNKLKKIVETLIKLKPKECRIMRENRPSIGQPLGKSKGFGFLSFNRHSDALLCLRKLNNNPNIFGKNNRPIVSFSIEDKTVHNIKQKRLERSREKNPLYKKSLEQQQTDKKFNKGVNGKKDGEKQSNIKTLKKAKKGKLDIKQNSNDNVAGYSGVVAEPGAGLHSRPQWKLKEQAMEHRKTIKAQKKELRKQKQQIILDKERHSIDRTKKRKRKNEVDNFTFLVDKYKKMLKTDDSVNSVKQMKRSKWYME